MDVAEPVVVAVLMAKYAALARLKCLLKDSGNRVDRARYCTEKAPSIADTKQAVTKAVNDGDKLFLVDRATIPSTAKTATTRKAANSQSL